MNNIEVRLRSLWRGLWPSSIAIDHLNIAARVFEDAVLSHRFAFMLVISCGIATLGLLLSSPAVIIGAMLISPLMGPIIGLGFSLALLDFAELRRSLLALTVGFALGVGVGWLIVLLSPLNLVTAEILSRTRPNFFDLLVAVFSGLAGGYAVVRQRGEAIVGVAIATALMPPLAVMGFGIATGSTAIVSGAFYLFMTNLLAMALAITVLAKCYGFGSQHGHRHIFWQVSAVVLIFVALSVPLVIALRDIAFEGITTSAIKRNVDAFFDGHQARVSQINVSFSERNEVTVEAIALTPKVLAEADTLIEQLLAEHLGLHVTAKIQQVKIGEDESIERRKLEEIAKSMMPAPPMAPPPPPPSLRDRVLGMAGFATAAIEINETHRRMRLWERPEARQSVTALRQLEAHLRSAFPDYEVEVIPKVRSLPSVRFATAEAELDEANTAVLADIVWVLQRWDATEAEVTGFASSMSANPGFDNRGLALRRAKVVAERLTAAGLAATVRAEYRAQEQREIERDGGSLQFQRVDVRVAATRDEMRQPEFVTEPAVVRGANSAAAPGGA